MASNKPIEMAEDSACAARGGFFLLTYLTLAPLPRAVLAHDIENLKPIFNKLRILWSVIKLILAYESKPISTLAPKR